jgi:tetratricopeptide (TPR) repeat protein
MHGRARPRTALALIAPALIAFSLAAPLAAQQKTESLDSMSTRAQEAISGSAFESAVKILTEAKAAYPDSPKPSIALADLFYDKELYTLALDEYKAAESKGADDFSTLTQISRSYGKLNREKESISYLVKIAQAYPDSADTVDDLGWMYFKTHQLDKGEEVLLGAIKRLGMRRGLAMTLGTIYSGMNRYDKSREYYLKSVEEAVASRDRDFAAIAYYNLSLLEHDFFHYNSALRATDDSLAQEDRPSGHLARGELLEARMDFAGAEQEYREAFATDTTPLSKVNLANLYQEFGRLDLARRYAEEVMGSKDLAWLLYYGTDTARHFQDLHELLAAVYEGLARREAGRPTKGFFDRVGALFNAGRYALVSWYHEQRFRAYCVSVGTQYHDQGSVEDAWWEYYRANEAYPEVALKYLGQARTLETARSPHAEPLYLLEEGKVRHSAAALEKALAALDPFWEREQQADGLVSLIPLLKGNAQRARRDEAIITLYGLNPGALPQAGIGLPLVVQTAGGPWTRPETAALQRFLRRSGSAVRDARAPGDSWRLTLTRENVAGKGTTVRWSLRDPATGTNVHEGIVTLGTAAGSAARRAATIVQAILEVTYAVH